MNNNVFPKSIQANPKWTSHESQFCTNCTCSMQCCTPQLHTAAYLLTAAGAPAASVYIGG